MRYVTFVLNTWRLWRRSGLAGVQRDFGLRLLGPHLWARYSQEALNIAGWMDFSQADLDASQALHQQFAGPLTLKRLGWFVPDFYHPFYGGIHTILRFAAHLQQQAGVQNYFFVVGNEPPARISARIAQAFPTLATAQVLQVNQPTPIAQLPATDASIATLWTTAYTQLKYNQTKRKFYFLQDYEPLFYPAGSVYAQTEATYRFGYYGLANTPTLKDIYTQQYQGRAECFYPCVDTQVFRPPTAPTPARPFTLFFYGRPEHPRNGFELGIAALRLFKQRYGARVRIAAAGDSWQPDDFDLAGVVENLGLLDYTQTAEFYRQCDAGLVLMFTRHPSYLPLELMASGALVVTNNNPATRWLLTPNHNCLLTEPSASCLADTLAWAVEHPSERQAIAAQGLQTIQQRHIHWATELDKIYRFMVAPH